MRVLIILCAMIAVYVSVMTTIYTVRTCGWQALLLRDGLVLALSGFCDE